MSNIKYDDTDYLINREESIEYKISDTNVSSIEKNIKRCEQLIKPEHANWIGISNQLAIAHVVDRVKELEAKLEFKNWGDLDNIQFEEYMNQFIPKQKVKDKIEEINKEYEDSKDENGNSEYYYPDYTIRKFKELLEEK